MPSPEPINGELFIGSVAMTLIMVFLYFFGIWNRSVVFPTHTTLSIKQQLIGGVPVAFLTMGSYVNGLEQKLLATTSHPGDWLVAGGTAIVFGMLSREGLERLTQVSLPVPIPLTLGNTEPEPPPNDKDTPEG